MVDYKNKVASLYVLSLSGLSLMILSGIIYITKIYTYYVPIEMEYPIISFLTTMKISLWNVARIYRIGIVIVVISSILLTKIVCKIKKSYFIVFCIPIIIFFIWNDIIIQQFLFLKVTDNTFYLVLKKVGDTFSKMVLFLYVITLVICLFIEYKKSVIFLKKKNIISIALFIIIFYMILIIVFVYGPFSSIWVNNLSAIGLPISSKYVDYNTLVRIALLCTLPLVILIIFKPFYDIVAFRIKNISKFKIDSENIRMIFHTYKNAFIGIKEMNELLMQKNSEGDANGLQRCGDVINEIVNEQIDFINRLCSMVGDIELEFETVEILNCLESAIKKIGISDIVQRNYQVDECLIYGDKFHLTEMFLNVLLNSVEAMEKALGKDNKIFIEFFCESDFCMIVIKDNGVGIEKKNIRKIFKPFYSTKTFKRGGIGMNYVDYIISKHRGKIKVESKVDDYTAISVAFRI